MFSQIANSIKSGGRPLMNSKSDPLYTKNDGLEILHNLSQTYTSLNHALTHKNLVNPSKWNPKSSLIFLFRDSVDLNHNTWFHNSLSTGKMMKNVIIKNWKIGNGSKYSPFLSAQEKNWVQTNEHTHSDRSQIALGKRVLQLTSILRKKGYTCPVVQSASVSPWHTF